MKRLGLVSVCLALVACGPTEDKGNPPVGGNGSPDGGNVVVCTNPPPDSDGDGISDHDEGADETPPRDTDGGGKPDFQDADSDGDGIPDAVEGRNANPCTPPADSDGDGRPDFQDLDSDDPNDASISDREEAGPDPSHP